MSPIRPAGTAIASPLFNPSARLRSMLGRSSEDSGDAERSAWSRAVEELVVRGASITRPLDDRDLAPLWLIEPGDPGLRAQGGEPEIDVLRAQLREAEGPWPQRLLRNEGHLHCLYVTSAHASNADGFYLANGGLLVARPGERFRVSRSCIPAAEKSPPRLPTPIEVWRHGLFARSVVAPSHGLAGGRNDLEGAVLELAPERWWLLKPWPPSRALPGTAFDHRVLGFYVMLVMFAALLSLLTGNRDGLVGAASLVAIAAGVMYGIRPRLFAAALKQTPKERASGVLSRLGRVATYGCALLALPAQTVLNPHATFFWLCLLPLVALLAAGPRRSLPWLALLALSSLQYGLMVMIE